MADKIVLAMAAAVVAIVSLIGVSHLQKAHVKSYADAWQELSAGATCTDQKCGETIIRNCEGGNKIAILKGNDDALVVTVEQKKDSCNVTILDTSLQDRDSMFGGFVLCQCSTPLADLRDKDNNFDELVSAILKENYRCSMAVP